MRTILTLALLTVCGRVGADPLWDAEVRMGYGVAVSGGGGMTTTRATPLTLSGLGSVAVSDEPHLYGYGGFVVETLDRSAAGMLAGVKLVPAGSHVRFTGGGAWIFAPYTLWGATASGGACGHASRGIGVCGDVQLTSYFAGTDLVNHRAVTQVQLSFGVVFDAP